MDWTQAITIILSIIIPISAGFGWIIHRMDNGFISIQKDIRQIDTRLSRLEGYMEGRDSRFKGIE